MEAVHRNRAAPGSSAASAVSPHSWWALPAWSILASQQMVAQGWRMMAERQGALMQAQLRLACLPWLLAIHAVRALPRPGPGPGPYPGFRSCESTVELGAGCFAAKLPLRWWTTFVHVWKPIVHSQAE